MHRVPRGCARADYGLSPHALVERRGGHAVPLREGAGGVAAQWAHDRVAALQPAHRGDRADVEPQVGVCEEEVVLAGRERSEVEVLHLRPPLLDHAVTREAGCVAADLQAELHLDGFHLEAQQRTPAPNATRECAYDDWEAVHELGRVDHDEQLCHLL